MGTRSAILAALASLLSPDGSGNVLLSQAPPVGDSSLKAASTGWVSAQNGVGFIKGLRSSAGGTVASQHAFSADSVTVRNPTTGSLQTVVAPATITCDLTVAGPVVNGRDTAAAFAASSWVHYYFIGNGTSLATIVSLSAPGSGGPALPPGYTGWTYIGPLFYSSSSTLFQGHFEGAWFEYSTPRAAVSAGSSTSVAGIALPTILPPNCMEMQLCVQSLSVTSTAAGAYQVSVNIQMEASNTVFAPGYGGVGAASANLTSQGGWVATLANTTQGINYQIILTSGTGPAVSIAILGYKVPNGGE